MSVYSKFINLIESQFSLHPFTLQGVYDAQKKHLGEIWKTKKELSSIFYHLLAKKQFLKHSKHDPMTGSKQYKRNPNAPRIVDPQRKKINANTGISKDIDCLTTALVIQFIRQTFGSSLWTSNDVYDAHIKYFAKELKTKKDLSALICHSVTSGYIERKKEKTNGLINYCLRTDRKMPDSKTTKRAALGKQILDFIKANYPYPAVFGVAEIKPHFTNVHESTVSYHLRSMGKNNVLILTGVKLKNGGFGFQLPTPKEKTAPPAVQIIEDQPANKSVEVIESTLPVSNTDLDSTRILTAQVLSEMGIPLALIGEGVFQKMRDMLRQIITLEDAELNYKRKIDELHHRIKEQCDQIIKLNDMIAKLNESQGRKYSVDGGTTKICTLGEMVRISTLQKKG